MYVVLSILISSVLLFTPFVDAQQPTRKPSNASGALPSITGTKDIGKNRACLSLFEAGVRRSEQVGKRTNKLIEKFETITGRVITFYETRVLPAGRTVPNYDALIAAIEAKKSAVNDELFEFQAVAADLDCNLNSPGTAMAGLRTKLQVLIKALNEYKTAVRNLIVAVHGATPDTGRPSLSVTPTIPVQLSPTE